MTEIILDDDYKVSATDTSWTLCRKGKKTWKPIAHYGSIEATLKHYIERSMRNSEATSINELIEVNNACLARIEDLFKDNFRAICG